VPPRSLGSPHRGRLVVRLRFLHPQLQEDPLMLYTILIVLVIIALVVFILRRR
jgi:hypothetical protein